MRRVEQLVEILRSIRFPFLTEEAQIHEIIANALKEAKLDYTHEYKLGTHARIDFFVDGVGIEIKKGRVSRAALLVQLRKYAVYDVLCAIIVVTQQGISLPKSICHKPIVSIHMYQSWSVSL